MTLYASRTKVPIAQSRTEIEYLLERYGADQFAYMADAKSASICFRAKGRVVRLVIKLSGDEAENRRLWRSLVLMVKSKLEAIASKIATFEDEFLPYTVMPNGQTVAEWAQPQIAQMIEEKRMPSMLLTQGVSRE